MFGYSLLWHLAVLVLVAGATYLVIRKWEQHTPTKTRPSWHSTGNNFPGGPQDGDTLIKQGEEWRFDGNSREWVFLRRLHRPIWWR